MASITQIQYAVALDQHRNFDKAADSCLVTQPTLSMQLQKLEEELGVVLFDRSHKPVVPTQEGALLLEQFRQALREYEAIFEMVHELNGLVKGEYRLGIIPTMAPYVLPPLLEAFHPKYPEVILRIQELTTDEIVEKLKNDTLDAGILATPLGNKHLVEYPICNEGFVLYHSPKLQVPTDVNGHAEIEKLSKGDLVVMQQGHCLRNQTLDLCAAGTQGKDKQGFVIEAGSLATLVRMVKQGPYFTILPALASRELRQLGEGKWIVEIAGELPYREISLVTHRTKARRALREALIAEATSVLEPLLTGQRKPGCLLTPQKSIQ